MGDAEYETAVPRARPGRRAGGHQPPPFPFLGRPGWAPPPPQGRDGATWGGGGGGKAAGAGPRAARPAVRTGRGRVERGGRRRAW